MERQTVERYSVMLSEAARSDRGARYRGWLTLSWMQDAGRGAWSNKTRVYPG